MTPGKTVADNRKTIEIISRGRYPLAECPKPILKALEIEIQRHMQAYGFTDVLVSTETVTDIEATP
jgi:hypothetical protein